MTQQTPEGKFTVNVPCDQGNEDLNNWNVGVVNEKENWIYADEYWSDYASDDRGIRELALTPEEKMSEFGDDKIWAYDNFPIKGFCTLMEKNLSTRIDGARHLTMYKNQGETDLKVRFIGDEGVYPEDDAKITWEVSEGGDKVIQLEPLNGGAQAHVTQIGDGSVYVTCTVSGIGTTVVQLDCSRLGIISAEINEDADVVYTGKEITPNVLVTNIYSEELKEGEEYELSYSDNIKCGIAKITATGINAYKDAAETYFPIVPSKAVIQDVSTKSGTVTVTLEDQSECGLTGYKVRIREKGTKDWTTVKVKAGEIKAQFKSLKKGTEYEVRACGYIDTSEAAGMYYGVEKEYRGENSDIQTVTCK